MGNDFWINETIRLYFETGSLTEANKRVKEMMKTYKKIMGVKNMTLNEYQFKAMRTAGVYESITDELLNGLMGLNGEAGEALDLLKKHLFQGHKLEEEHIEKELGDCLWYIALTADALGTSLEEVAAKNIEKLEKRYPTGFDAEYSINRREGDI